MAHSDDKPETADPVVKGSKGKDASVTSAENNDRSDKTSASQEKEVLGNKDSSNKDKSKLKSKSHLTVKNHNNDHTNPKYEKNCNKDGEYSSKREKHGSTAELCKAKETEQKEKKEVSLSESKRKKRKDSHRESSSSEEEKSKTSSRQRHSSKASSHGSERNLRKTRKQHHRRSRGSGSSSPFHSSSISSSSSCSSSSSDTESSVNSNSESNDSHSEKKRRKVEGHSSHSSSEGKLSKKKYKTHSKERKNENTKSALDGVFKDKSPGSTPAIEEDSDISRLEEGEDTSSLPMDGDWKLHPEKQIKKEENIKYLKPGTRKLSISSSHRKIKQEDSSGDQKSPRKRRWGSSTTLPKASLSISTDSLKTLIPDYKPVMTILTEVEELIPATTPDDSPGSKKEKLPMLEEEEKQDNQEASSAGETSPLKAPLMEGSHVASPSHNPPSCIIHIKNLVRPFTLQQLKDLLNQTGTLVERGFWIDKIKSKCYVTYETEEQAIRTRDLLHNARWPVSNPKTLIVDFATQDELDYHKDLSSQPPKAIPPSGLEKGNNRGQFHLEEVGHRRREEREDRRREKGKQREATAPPIREWDKDKVAQESPEREHRQKSREKEKPRSAEKKKDKKDSKRKQEEETPAKLLDGLFRKTKTTPCIYWLPLTEEQIQQRKQRKEEMRQKRMQEKKEQEEAERSQRQKGKDNRGREKETSRRSQSRSPVGRRR